MSTKAVEKNHEMAIKEAGRLARDEAIKVFKERRKETAVFRRKRNGFEKLVQQRIDAVLVNLVRNVILPQIGVGLGNQVTKQKLREISDEMAGLYGDVVTCMADCRMEIVDYIIDYSNECLLTWFGEDNYPGAIDELQRLAAGAVLTGFAAFFEEVENPVAARYVGAILGMQGVAKLDAFLSGKLLELRMYGSHIGQLEVLGNMSLIYRSLLETGLDMLLE